MSTISYQVLDKHFIATLVGEPVTEFRIKKCNSGGDSVASSILSLDVRTASGEIINIIFKSMTPLTPYGTPFTDGFDGSSIEIRFRSLLEVYTTEIQFYQSIAPLLESLCNEENRPPQPLPIPKLYASNDSESSAYLALHDLRPLGFKPAEKTKGLSSLEVNLVMETIAKFHAKSYVLLKTQGSSLFITEKSAVFLEKHPLHCRKGIKLRKIFEDVYSGIQQVFSKTNPKLAEKMLKFESTCYERMLRSWSEVKKEGGLQEKYFPVLNHGDLWIENILFRYSDCSAKTPLELKLIDFQLCRRGSIYDDLLYFFLTSTTPKFRKENLPSSLKLYFETFSNTLGKAGVSLPSNFNWDSFILTFNDNWDGGFCHFVFSLPFQLGVFLPPPSPVPQLAEIESVVKHFDHFEADNAASNDTTAGEISLMEVQGFVDAMGGALVEAFKNSFVAKKRLELVVEEMVSLNVL